MQKIQGLCWSNVADVTTNKTWRIGTEEHTVEF